MLKKRSSNLIVLGLLGMVCCSRSKLAVSMLELRRPGANEPVHEFAVGEHVQIACRVDGLTLDRGSRYNLQADAEILAANTAKAGQWDVVWSSYTFFQENRPAAQGQPSVRLQGDIVPGVDPGSYKLRLRVRDVQAMTKREIDADIRVTPLQQAAGPATTVGVGPTGQPLGPPQTANDLFQKGYALFQAGDADGALHAFETALALDPKFPELNFNVGMLHLKKNELSQARTFFEAELQRDPEHYGSLSRLADMSNDARDTAAAKALYERAAAAAPRVYYPHFKLGEIYLAQKQYDLAIQSFEQTLVLDPGNEWASINMGTAYYRKGDNSGALRVFERLAANPGAQSVVHFNYALALYKAGDLAKAKVEAEKAKSMGAPIDSEFLAMLERGQS